MKSIIFATHNPHKVFEVGLIMNVQNIEIKSLKEVSFNDEIIEDGNTFRENALKKVEALLGAGYKNIIGEDSGLEVEALDGAPGIYSARYSGEPVNHDNNIEKLLTALKDEENRKARFNSTICFAFEGEIHYFEGYCYGQISKQRMGAGGFGYDPVFIPDGYEESFGMLSDKLKSSISHRYNSFKALGKYLQVKINDK